MSKGSDYNFETSKQFLENVTVAEIEYLDYCHQMKDHDYSHTGISEYTSAYTWPYHLKEFASIEQISPHSAEADRVVWMENRK